MAKLKIKAPSVKVSWSPSLTALLAIAVFLISTVVLTFAGVYYSRLYSSGIEEDLVRRSSVPAMMLEQSADNLRMIHSPKVLRRLTGRAVSQAMYISPEGKILYSLNDELEGVRLVALSEDHPVFDQITRSEFEVQLLETSVRTATTLNLVLPIRKFGQVDGYLWIEINTCEDSVKKRQGALFFFVGAVSAILLSGLVQFLWVYRLVVPRVRRMARCVQIIEGGNLQVRIVGRRMHDELGELETSINKMAEELDARGKFQQELKVELERARDRNASIADVSREVSPAVAAVVALSGRLLESELEERQRALVENINRSGEYLTGVFDNIVAMDELEPHDRVPELEPMSIRELFSELQERYQSCAHGCGLDFECVVEEDVPDFIVSSSQTLGQIFGNLLLSGFRFTAEGHVHLQAGLLEADAEGNRAVIMFSVRDSGGGLSADAHQRIFEVFEREKSKSSPSYTGIGLGLTISRQLVELLGGELELNGDIEDGASFCFSLNVAFVAS